MPKDKKTKPTKEEKTEKDVSLEEAEVIETVPEETEDVAPGEEEEETIEAAPEESKEEGKEVESEGNGDDEQIELVAEPRTTLQDIGSEMETSYLDYAMSVIVARALPDVRDGLKPVHRRILYTMLKQGLRSNAKYKKSAHIVGDTMAKYHPHGDTAIYDTMVRMAQDFSMRYPLVDGQGNFGSIDGDSAAAYRYTEARMTSIAEAILTDIEKETVNFVPNYDASHTEPSVLPAKLPNLLLNGSDGIAVGMATKIPPHNLREVIDATCYLIDNPDAEIEDLMEFIKGPDFPTAGTIYNYKEIKNAYATGKGKVLIRAKADIEEVKGGKFQIIISEIPYQVNKANLVIKIADLVKDKKIDSITDIRDESNRDGIRVVVELKKDSYPKKVLNKLYKLTDLQTAFHMNMIALVDGIQPRLLSLKSMLEYYIKHRQEVVRRRTEYELRIAKERAHILEGLKIALDNIDAVIKTIKASKTKEEAHDNLMKKFKLSDLQSTAILEMKLQTLAGLERQKIEDELKEKMKLIKELEAILASDKKILGIVKEELNEMKDKYGDERRTKVYKQALGEFSDEDLVPDEQMIIILTKGNYIKRLKPTTYKSQGRGGKGIVGMTTKEEDEIASIISASTHDDILFFTDKGRVFKLKVFEIPETTRQAKGQAIVNLINALPSENVTATITLSASDKKYLFMATRGGVVKKTEADQFSNIRQNGLIALKLKDDDKLYWVKETSGESEIMMVTKHGMSVHFSEKDVRPMGRSAAGVRGIKLREKDEVVQMDIVSGQNDLVLTVMENGFGKCSKIKEYKLQNRGGIGIKTASITAKNGNIIGAGTLPDSQGDLVLISKNGQVIRLPLSTVPCLGRATQGVTVMRFKEKGDKVASMTVISEQEEEEQESQVENGNGDEKKGKNSK